MSFLRMLVKGKHHTHTKKRYDCIQQKQNTKNVEWMKKKNPYIQNKYYKSNKNCKSEYKPCYTMELPASAAFYNAIVRLIDEQEKNYRRLENQFVPFNLFASYSTNARFIHREKGRRHFHARNVRCSYREKQCEWKLVHTFGVGTCSSILCVVQFNPIIN